MNSSTIEKIKKLLSLAQSDNANERDAALAKAHAIATEHSIDMALLDTSDVGVVKEEAMIEDQSTEVARLDVKVKFVAGLIHDFWNVELLYGWTSGKYVDGRYVRGNRTVCFLGKVSDVEQAKWLYSYMCDEWTRRWKQEQKLHGLPASHRNTFFLGIRNGLSTRLCEEKEATEEAAIARHAVSRENCPHVPVSASATEVTQAYADKTEELSNRYQLARVNEKETRRKFLKEKYPRLGRSRASSVNIRSHDTYASGVSHGRSMSINKVLT